MSCGGKKQNITREITVQTRHTKSTSTPRTSWRRAACELASVVTCTRGSRFASTPHTRQPHRPSSGNALPTVHPVLLATKFFRHATWRPAPKTRPTTSRAFGSIRVEDANPLLRVGQPPFRDLQLQPQPKPARSRWASRRPPRKINLRVQQHVFSKTAASTQLSRDSSTEQPPTPQRERGESLRG